MKTLAASAAAFALLCSAPAVAGDDLTVRVTAPGSYQMPRSEFRDYAYSYDLSNGKSIRFLASHKRYFVQVDDAARTELTPVAPGVLVTAAGARIEFNWDGGLVTVRNFERLPMKVAMQGTNLTLVAAR